MRNRASSYTIVLSMLVIAATYNIYVWAVFVDIKDARIEAPILPIFSQVGGRLEQVYVIDHSMVSAGETLAVVESDDFNSAVTRTQARLSIAELKSDTKNGTPGTSTSEYRAGLSAANALEQKIKSAEVVQELSQVRLATSEKSYLRAKELLQQGTISAERFEAVELEFQQASLHARTSEIEIVSLRHLHEASVIRSKVLRLHVHQSVAELAIARADYDDAVRKSEEASIRSPVSGQVIRSYVRRGQLIEKDQMLFELTELEDIWVTAKVKQSRIDEIALNMEAQISIDGEPFQSITGFVDAIGGSTTTFDLNDDEVSLTDSLIRPVAFVPIRIRISDSRRDSTLRMKPGMTVDVRIKVKEW